MTTIFEALFILALGERDGDIIKSSIPRLEPVLAGAVLAELVLLNRIVLRNQRIVVENQTPTEHPILDVTLYEILESNKARKLKYWINTMTDNKIIEDIGHCLVEQGVLYRKKKHLWMLIPHDQGTNNKVPIQSDLKKRLKDIALAREESDLAEKVLLAFLYSGDLLKLVFKHSEQKTAQRRVKKLIFGNEEGSKLGETLDEIMTIACKSE